MLNVINQFCHNYYQEIPNGSLNTIAVSAASSFVVSAMFTSCIKPDQLLDLSRPLLATGVSIVAATIHALTIPMFNHCFNNPQNKGYSPLQDFIQLFLSLSISEVLINTVSINKTHIFTATYNNNINSIHLLFLINTTKMAIGAAVRIIVNQTASPGVSQINLTFDDPTIFGFNFKNNSTPYYIMM